MKNLSNSVLVAFLLIGLFASFQIKVANASGTIYILSDGTISPPSSPILTSDGVTYTLTADINDSIVVERSNIIIDGAGHTVEGSGTDNGFKLVSISNVTIRNTHIKNFTYGVYIESASSITLIQNNITANSYDGIGLFFSNRTIITGNNIASNGYDGIEIYELSLIHI